MSMLLSAFLTGIFASFHCFGMCGPLNAAFLSGKGNTAFMLYHAGRIMMYAFFGFIAGIFGSAFHWAGLQQYVSIISGAVILVVALISFSNLGAGKSLVPKKWRNKVIGLFSFAGNLRKRSHFFLLGLLNGLLPCGIIYTALALALSSGSTGSGVLVMILFGLGTFPAFVVLKTATRRINIHSRAFRTINTWVTICVAVLLIIRGANLGIPYLSPEINEQGVECCTKPAK